MPLVLGAWPWAGRALPMADFGFWILLAGLLAGLLAVMAIVIVVVLVLESRR